jgi:hypothetical protein
MKNAKNLERKSFADRITCFLPLFKIPDLNNSTSMPTFAIYTNLTKEKIPTNFVLDASKFIAEKLGKPESVSDVNHWEQKKKSRGFSHFSLCSIL